MLVMVKDKIHVNKRLAKLVIKKDLIKILLIECWLAILSWDLHTTGVRPIGRDRVTLDGSVPVHAQCGTHTSRLSIWI